MKQNKIDDMLVSYLLGEATAAERQIVEQWLKDSDANRYYFQSFKAAWDHSKDAGVKTSVTADEAWARFCRRIQSGKPASRTIPISYFLRVAAMVVLIVGVGWWMYSVKTKEHGAVLSRQEINRDNTPVEQVKVISESQATVSNKPQQPPIKNTVTAVLTSRKKGNTAAQPDCGARKFACNSTSCPLEICIIQRSTCKDMPFSISNCSRIEPDQAGQLCYKPAEDKFYQNCALQVEEIRITRVPTGETIVLDSHSSPVTAQEFFHYMTGEKKGDVVAGVFNSDCNNNNDRGLSIDNYSGNLLFR